MSSMAGALANAGLITKNRADIIHDLHPIKKELRSLELQKKFCTGSEKEKLNVRIEKLSSYEESLEKRLKKK
jgi:hypothetical protein